MSRKYLEIVEAGTSYAKNMDTLRRCIFGEVTRPTHSQSMKVIKLYSEKPAYKRPEIINYYPEYSKITNVMFAVRTYGLFRDEHQDFLDEFQRLRKLRGKGVNFMRKWKEAKKKQ